MRDYIDQILEEAERLIWEDENNRKKGIRRIRRQATKCRSEIIERDNYTCRICGKDGRYYPTELEVDHIVPVSKGGTSDQENLQTLCITCNRKKHAKII